VGLDKNGKDNIESQVLMVAESNFSISAGIHGLMIILDSRLRGNDRYSAARVIPAKAGIQLLPGVYE